MSDAVLMRHTVKRQYFFTDLAILSEDENLLCLC
ncbi:Uncharacterised protein [Candidatus Venteria ishoeyi]|uniref:Uncharacterized protein n=1 Tax=Candidatus Venteria ishoeyi TaxID=1899563 RepID=A0A1H6F2S9_9GAMM|nr:Uncharacterised protein [Candidatus Venteria ishoeyi]